MTAELTELDQPMSEQDAVWAEFNTPLSTLELMNFCKEDVERLFRINPYLEFKHWKRLADNHYSFSGRNNSQKKPFDFAVELKVEQTPNGLHVHYQGGLKKDTIFRIDSSEYGSKLSIHEHYPFLGEKELEHTLNEVDQSLTTWAGEIQKYLLMWDKWKWFAPWCWYMNTVWKKMKPSGRRIAYMIWWITLVEIALIILGVGIYWAEYL